MTVPAEIRHYVTRFRKDVFDDWLSSVSDVQAQARIAARINRLAAGNFGDCKALGRALYEMRMDWGPGYRVYHAVTGKDRVLLLCGGDKGSQATDIEQAHKYLKDYRSRSQTQ